MRGPNVFPGYWRNPDATAAVLRDGWLHTGDVAEVDDEGCYRIRGRLKDMFISGGENVYPAEVESVLHEHAAVADAPSSACRTSAGARSASRSSSRSEPVDRRGARRALPRAARAGTRCRSACVFVDALPMSAMNKVLKDELRALVGTRR